MVTFPGSYVVKNCKKIPPKVDTLAKGKVVGYNRIKACPQLLDLLSWFDCQFQDDMLNLDLKEYLGIGTLLSKTWK